MKLLSIQPSVKKCLEPKETYELSNSHKFRNIYEFFFIKTCLNVQRGKEQT